VQRALSIYDGDETLSFDSYANMSVDSSRLRRYQFSLGKKRRRKFIILKIEMKIVVTAQLQKLLKSKEEYINNQLDAMDDEASRIIELGDTAEYIQHLIGCYGG
jgi:transposase